MARLLALNLPLHVLNVQLCFHFSFIDSFLFLKNFTVVLVLLLTILVGGLSLVLSDRLDLDVQLFFLLAKPLELLLLHQFLRDVVREGLVLQLEKLFHQVLVPITEFSLVLLDLPLVALHIWVVLQLTAQLTGRLLKAFFNGLNQTR